MCLCSIRIVLIIYYYYYRLYGYCVIVKFFFFFFFNNTANTEIYTFSLHYLLFFFLKDPPPPDISPFPLPAALPIAPARRVARRRGADGGAGQGRPGVFPRPASAYARHAGPAPPPRRPVRLQEARRLARAGRAAHRPR